MKILIVGLGSIGRRHLRNLVSLGEKDIILYRTHKSTLSDDEISDFPVVSDLQKAFQQKIAAVIISNPTALHLKAAEVAVKANAHIFMEKPISHAIDTLQPFEMALKNSKSIVFTAYQFRFNPGLKKIKQIIDKQEMGRPILFQSTWGEYLPDWHPWEDYRDSYAAKKELGGGVVLTLSHPIDYLRWIFGEVQELFAYTGNLSDINIDAEDSASILFKYHSGVEGMLHLDYFSRPKKHALSIICTDGVINWDYKTSIVYLEHSSGEIKQIKPPKKFERNQMYLDEMRHFIEICKEGAEPICSYRDGKKALEIAWAIKASGRYHERVIFEN